MNDLMKKNLELANSLCSFRYIKDVDEANGFLRLYPFTTENISGYINLFDLDNKSLLTVGSSCDQVINALLFNCIDQTIYDICPFTKYYFYLKKASIINLNLDEFYSFLLYRDYPKFCYKNKNALNMNTFNKIKDTLKSINYESFYFWSELLNLYDPVIIRQRLFSYDEDRDRVIKKMNIYMRNEYLFKKTKKAITYFEPKFIYGDINEIKLNRTFDNVWLSNLGLYLGIEKLDVLVRKILPFVNEKILLCYLYNTRFGMIYNTDWADIYNLEKVYKFMGKYITSFDTFTGVKGILFNDDMYQRDSVLICDKRKLLIKK